MRFDFFRSKRKCLFDKMLEAERNPPPPVAIEAGNLAGCMPIDEAGPAISPEDNRKFRRILAMVHYGEPGEDLAGRELLSEGEREYLDAYALSERWARFRVSQMRARRGLNE